MRTGCALSGLPVGSDPDWPGKTGLACQAGPIPTSQGKHVQFASQVQSRPARANRSGLPVGSDSDRPAQTGPTCQSGLIPTSQCKQVQYCPAKGASAHPSMMDTFLASAESAVSIYNGTFCHFALPSLMAHGRSGLSYVGAEPTAT